MAKKLFRTLLIAALISPTVGSAVSPTEDEAGVEKVKGVKMRERGTREEGKPKVGSAGPSARQCEDRALAEWKARERAKCELRVERRTWPEVRNPPCSLL